VSEYPDVLGFELEDALVCMAREGWQVSIKTTSPPGVALPGPRRVLRLIIIGERRVEIVVAHEGSLIFDPRRTRRHTKQNL
jgi:hypothetical protein